MNSEFDYNKVYYKFIKDDYSSQFGDYTYRLGVNLLNEDFIPKPTCSSGGLFFCDMEHLYDYRSFGPIVCVLSIPPDARVVKVDNNKYKADKVHVQEFKNMVHIQTCDFLIDNEIYTPGEICEFAAKKNLLNVLSHFSQMDIHPYHLNRCLALASSRGHFDIVKYLVKIGANVYWNQEIAIRNARSCPNPNVLEFLIKVSRNLSSPEEGRE